MWLSEVNYDSDPVIRTTSAWPEITYREMLLATIFALITNLYTWYEWEWIKKPGGRVKFLPFGLVIKCGPLGGADEADTIRFIRKHTTIPVPRVLLSARGYSSEFMLMRYVDGVNLESAWCRLDEDQRANVVRQLRSIVMELRSLQPAHSNPLAICGLNNVACKDGRVSSNPFGPFADESGFNDHLIHVAEIYMDPIALSEIRARMRDDHRVMFTHGDLAPRNIIVRGDEILAVIDWEHAGWYPEHWELVKALYAPMVEKDTSWTRAVREVIPLDYETEWHVDRELSDNMVGGF
ncbi:hypothetical protein EW146_g2648 [Bondarzewia mesenterica]|uniref:Aminoglycoside phosphotransferase domain-containing protein n=1 Tax=Bondarzewia mesenterica TaxID=1095465 RepID=A0A4S4M2C7_9AGAM|nr:hypothetical protein EW146_g2648 [Bondarzewia mesenterica]